jgi:Xaa-Pro dipeptidase
VRATAELPFPLEEFEARLAATRVRMAAAGIDLLVLTSPENLYYLSGYESAGYLAMQALLVGFDAEPVLVTRQLEAPNAAATSVHGGSVAYQDHEDPLAVVAREIEGLGLARHRIGVERRSRHLTVDSRDRLGALLPRAEIGEGSGVVEAVRLRKSARELDLIRAAGRIVDRTMEACLAGICAGVRERELAAEIYRASLLAGSEYSGTPPFVTSGPRSARPHATWSDRVIQAGDPVFVEVAACRRRYHAVLMRTAVAAPASARVRAMHAASRAGLEAALAAIRPGVPAAHVERACRGAIARAGWADAFRLRAGYSMGLGFEGFAEGHILSLHRREPTPLEAGMVLHLVPFLMVDGEAGLAVSETVIVTEAGAEVACRVSRELHVG